MRAPKVLVLSYYNDPNFGDRLGYHLINAVLPPSALVIHATVLPWSVPDENFDLLVLGIGNSLNAATVRRDELFSLVDRIPNSVGIFGTQYPTQYGRIGQLDRLKRLLGTLSVWFARYQQDIRVFGEGRDNIIHLGDWLISAFPMTRWRKSQTLIVPPEIKTRQHSLDRTIQRIQAYRRVDSARLHPLLCALTSAEEVAYREQYEDPFGSASGKFEAMLLDVFGASHPPGEFFKVNRQAVAAYKVKVADNIEVLRQTFRRLLDSVTDADTAAAGPR